MPVISGDKCPTSDLNVSQDTPALKMLLVSDYDVSASYVFLVMIGMDHIHHLEAKVIADIFSDSVV